MEQTVMKIEEDFEFIFWKMNECIDWEDDQDDERIGVFNPKLAH